MLPDEGESLVVAKSDRSSVEELSEFARTPQASGAHATGSVQEPAARETQWRTFNASEGTSGCARRGQPRSASKLGGIPWNKTLLTRHTKPDRTHAQGCIQRLKRILPA